MSLALGPGKGGIEPTASLELHVGQHVDYIKSLDTVRRPVVVGKHSAEIRSATGRNRLLADRAFATKWYLLGSDSHSSAGIARCPPTIEAARLCILVSAR